MRAAVPLLLAAPAAAAAVTGFRPATTCLQTCNDGVTMCTDYSECDHCMESPLGSGKFMCMAACGAPCKTDEHCGDNNCNVCDAGTCSTKRTTPAVASWASHGELTDEAALAKPALSDELIRAVNSDPRSTWVAGRNRRFEGMTLKQAKVLMGALQNTDKGSWPPHKPAPLGDIPDEFDWRTDARAAKCPSVKEIRDQANCGSCWAFGSVEAMTDRICIASQGAQTPHLSAQDMMACNKETDMGCSGGVPSTCYSYWKSNGVVTGGNYGDKSGCWSYQIEPCAHHTNSTKYPSCDSTPTGKAGSCAKQCKDNTALDWKTDKHHGKEGGYSVCKQGSGTKCKDAMAQEIYQNGPITAQFFVHQSFESYKSGVYQHTGMADPMLGGHAIKIVGYGNENGTPYWLVANSWNEDWGMNGFFKIIRGKNEGQIEDPIINGGPVAGEPQL